jgi:site-specific recombinase XerD
MKLYFELKKKTKKSKTGLIRAIIISSGKKERISTGISIEAKNWDKGNPKAISANANINLSLKKYEGAFTEYITMTTLANEIPSLSSAKDFVTANVNGVNKERGQKDIRDILELFQEEKRNSLKEGAIKPYVTMVNHLYDYNKNVQFADFTHSWGEKWKKWLSQKGTEMKKRNEKKSEAENEKVRDLQNGSINKQIVALKSFCKWAVKKKFTSVSSFNDIEKIKKVIDQRIIALTQNEFNLYANYDFGDNKPVEEQRDVFCFGCYTGLRFEDLSRVKDFIKKSGKDYYLHLNTDKTNHELKMRLVDEAVAILQRYDFVLPIISNQKCNKQIKAGIKKCGIDRQETVVVQYLNKVTYPKQYVCDIISIHDARKTFITRCLEAGMSLTEVMAMSTHNDFRSVQRYIDLERERINTKLQSVFSLSKVA